MIFLKELPWLLASAAAACCLSVAHYLLPSEIPASQEPVLAVTSLTGLAIGIALAYAASLFLEKKENSPVVDDKPTTLSKRGSYITWHIGRRRIGPWWAGPEADAPPRRAWAGQRQPPAGNQVVYHENAWHQLCVGPCESLRGIYQGGKLIFDGPITQDSHPSGSEVNLGKEGKFTIYWGEEDQPVNNYLGNSDRVGISSRWPGMCYVVWKSKRLGPSPHWPMMEYVLERKPKESILSDSDAWFEPDYTFPATPNMAVIYSYSTGGEGSGYLEVASDQSYQFDPSDKVQLWDSSSFVRDEFILDLEYEQVNHGTPSSPDWRVHTKFYITGGVSVGDASLVSIRRYTLNAEVGVNPAHAIADMLFATWPYGLGLDQDYWDMDSLEDMGELFSEQTGGEGLWTSWLAADGKKGL